MYTVGVIEKFPFRLRCTENGKENGDKTVLQNGIGTAQNGGKTVRKRTVGTLNGNRNYFT